MCLSWSCHSTQSPSEVENRWYRALSQRADIGLGWVSEFMASGTGSLSRAEAVVAAIRDICPSGESGDELRRLPARFDTGTDERDAA